MSSDFVRMRHHFEGEGPHRHPLISGVRYLLDAGAVPVALEGPMRGIAKERMDSGTKVLLAGLTRAWDPDGVLGDPPGLL